MATSTTILTDNAVELSYWTPRTSGTVDRNDFTARRSRESSDPEGRDVVIQQLLPVDGGPAAWKLLIAAFVFEALLWGMSLIPTSINSSIF